MSSKSPSKFRQIVVMFVCPVVLIVGLKTWSLKRMDRALTIAPPTAEELVSGVQCPREDGSWVDGKALFAMRRDAELTPLEENGWRELVKAFGPIALGKEEYSAIPWEELSTNESSKEWYENVWKPLCGELGIDPGPCPPFFKRSSLAATLVKYGATGMEAETPPDDERYLEYYENGVKKRGKLTVEEIDGYFERLASNPWKETQFPPIARWIRENADLYDACAKAVRTPRFGSYRVIPESLKDLERLDCGDLRFIQTLGLLFVARANNRIASGEISGAIDDVESLLLLTKPLLKSNDRFIQDRGTALDLLEKALSVGIYANASKQPTKNESDRWIALWREQIDNYDFEEALIQALEGVRDLSLIPSAQAICQFRREHGSIAKLFAEMTGDEQWKAKAAEEGGNPFLKRFFLFRPVFDDQYLLEKIATDYKELMEKTLQGEKCGLESEEEGKRPGSSRRRIETGLAVDLVKATAVPMTELARAYRRVASLARLHTIAAALLAYQEEHGTLPPAYSVDLRGKPLHSWRVLILPYLGEEELYSKFALNEPWDSETNAPLQNEAPNVYRRPGGYDDESSATYFSTILGEDALFTYGGLARDLDVLRAPRRLYESASSRRREDRPCRMDEAGRRT